MSPIDSRSTTPTASTPVPVDHGRADIIPTWKPKSPFERFHQVATFGSCFARHLATALPERGYCWFDAEPAPDIFSPEIKAKYNFGVFSARTGEISTIAALRQWISWAIGTEPPADEIWHDGSRFFDPFRSSIEPNGFAGPDELLASRDSVLRALRKIIEQADRLVITLSNTTGWIHSSKGHVYSNYPGTIARNIASDDYRLRSFSLAEISGDMSWIVKTISRINTKARFLFTVSATSPTAAARDVPPVGETTSSKTILCSAARNAAHKHALVDYFPSYEIITGVESGIIRCPSLDLTRSNPGLGFAIDYFFTNLNPTADTKVVLDGPVAEQAGGPQAGDPEEFWWRVLKIRNDLRGLF
ncbi:MAG TPA: GSCFA domain-containing protein [Candidatus Binataceae bacterium]|nr:GSCFA domain-containing protein [Candidatus Binataceae bacterium]